MSHCSRTAPAFANHPDADPVKVAQRAPKGTNSHQQLIMADVNHKARPPVTERSVTIQESWRYQNPARMHFHRPKTPPLSPWMKLSGRWIETAGLEPGQRVRITVEHQKLIITPL